MRRLKKLEELLEINAIISSKLDTRDILKSITLSSIALLQCDSAEVWRLADGTAPVDAASGRSHKKLRFELLESAGTSDIGDGEKEHAVLELGADAIQEQQGNFFVAEGLTAALSKVKAFAKHGHAPKRTEAAFFEIGEQGYGLFTIGRDENTAFNEEDYYFLERLAVQAGISLVNSRRYEAVEQERDQAVALLEQSRDEAIIGASPAVEELRRLIDLAGPSQAPVLVLGERGVGKELVAESLHQRSDRADGPLIKINCAGVVETLLESELFGHEKGAFTGADRTKPGLLEEADGGTLFLDEVGEMSPGMQSKLLRFLQEGTLRRVGGKKEIQTNVRVIAATNRDLTGDSSEDGESFMRRDLFDRLATIILRIPPLRERREDIALLGRHFLKRYAALEHKDVDGFAPSVLQRLEAADWPGNVRELENTVHRLVILHAGGDVLSDPTHIDVAGPGAAAAKRAKQAASVDATAADSQSFFDAKAAFEESYVRRALQNSGGNISKAARESGLDRGNFKLKMSKYEIDPQNP